MGQEGNVWYICVACSTHLPWCQKQLRGERKSWERPRTVPDAASVVSSSVCVDVLECKRVDVCILVMCVHEHECVGVCSMWV